LWELGIVTASPIASEHPRAELFAEFDSWSGTGPDLNRYVALALKHASDVPEKLLRHSPDGPKHAFIWVGISSLYPGWSSMRDPTGALPLDEPDLPDGVTDIWLATFMRGQETLHLAAGRGWERTGRFITETDGQLFESN
jgi:hypothetical protein